MDVRSVALSFPATEEQSHHGIPSFRVGGKIFATLPDPQHVRVMVGDEAIRAAVAEEPDSCAEFYWGKRLACVEVDIQTVDDDLLRGLLTEAWLRKAPAALTRTLDAGH